MKTIHSGVCLYGNNGNIFGFFLGVHSDAKMLLKSFTFSKESKINLQSANNGGIAKIFIL